MTQLAREAGRSLPVRITRRRERAAHGSRPDLRRSLREAARRDGEVFSLPMTRRRMLQRRIVLLIDVSGSMSERTEASLTFAHALVQAAERVEVFTLGTRLTRVSAGLRPQDRAQALARVGGLIADIDGGTRIGDALQSFLAVPRFQALARGGVVLVLSDGLERGDSAAMVAGAQRLSRLAWRLTWLSPLAGQPGYSPETAALSAVLPHLDGFAAGGSVAELVHHVLGVARAA